MRAEKEGGGNLLLTVSIVIIAGTLAVYLSLLYHWLADAPAPKAEAPIAVTKEPAKAADPAALEAARQAYRDNFLDARAWLRLSEALLQAGRPVDAFYVMYGAREFFGDGAFSKAHAQVILRSDPDQLGAADEELADEPRLKARLQTDPDNPALLVAAARLALRAGKPAEASRVLDVGLAGHPENRALLYAKAQLLELTDLMAAIQAYARLAHLAPDTYEGKAALEYLGRLAAQRDEGPRGEAVRLAREALEELRKAHPADPAIFATAALAAWSRGEPATARAMAEETGRKNPQHAGVAMVEGALALEERDVPRAIKKFTAAYERNPDDLYSASKLAAIYSQQRGDPEAALPYLIALYRRDPRREEGGEPVERAIRRTLDARRQQLLKNVPAEGLGRYLKNEDASLRAEACVRAAELKDPRWLELLAELLDDDTEIVRHNADYALYQLAKAYPDAVQVRRDDWLANNRPVLRARVLNLFADLWPQETLPLALRALYDQNPALRYLTKTMVMDRYYAKAAAARKATADYLSQEKSPQVLAMYDIDRRRARAEAQQP